MGNKGNKFTDILRKLYRFRVRIDRQGKPVLNVSSIFAGICLLFAPRLSIACVVVALVMGYQLHFETEEEDAGLEEKIRKAAQNVKNGAANAVKSVQEEIRRARNEHSTTPAPAEESPKQEAAAEPAAQPAEEPTAPAGPTNDELLEELTARTAEIESNPAATTFHNSFTASSGSVPVLLVDYTPEEPEPRKPKTKSGK